MDTFLAGSIQVLLILLLLTWLLVPGASGVFRVSVMLYSMCGAGCIT
jgi:hypothetical protein